MLLLVLPKLAADVSRIKNLTDFGIRNPLNSEAQFPNRVP
jgi:hypothetical protein